MTQQMLEKTVKKMIGKVGWQDYISDPKSIRSIASVLEGAKPDREINHLTLEHYLVEDRFTSSDKGFNQSYTLA